MTSARGSTFVSTLGAIQKPPAKRPSSGNEAAAATVAPSRPAASSMARTRSCWRRLTIGPTTERSSNPSPTGRSRTARAKRSRNSSWTFSCTSSRSVPEHAWPLLKNTLWVRPRTASSRSASGNTSEAFLPPSSIMVGRMRRAAAARIFSPVRSLPVNVMKSMAGCSTRLTPVSTPPVTTFRTPAGRSSAASSAMRSDDSGVSGAGLRTIVLPVASASAVKSAVCIGGQFHGMMAATTPWGSNTIFRISSSPSSTACP